MVDSDNWAYELNSRRKEAELCEQLKRRLHPTPFSYRKDKRTVYYFSTKEKMIKFIQNAQ